MAAVTWKACCRDSSTRRAAGDCEFRRDAAVDGYTTDPFVAAIAHGIGAAESAACAACAAVDAAVAAAAYRDAEHAKAVVRSDGLQTPLSLLEVG